MSVRSLRESDFDKYLLVPQYSTLNSREEVNLYQDFLGLGQRLPFMLSPMATVSDGNTCNIVYQNGAIGALHRYMSMEKQCNTIAGLSSMGIIVGASIGTTNTFPRIDALYGAGANFFIIDVAHGHTKACLDTVTYIKNKYTDIPVISGNIVTKQAADDYVDAGIDALRVGIGSGSVCTTRQVCGVGYNQLDAISEIHSRYPEVPILSCGGIRNSGDIVKAMSFGASGVIIGKLFATCFEAPGNGKHYGMASREAEMMREDLNGENGMHHVIAPEGFSEQVKQTQYMTELIESLQAGVKAGFAYMGARNIQELWNNAEWKMD